MKINHISKYIISSLAASCLLSCSFLDVVPPETEGPEDFLIEAEDALKYLYGCYGTLLNNNTKVLSYNTLAFGSDEVVGPETVYDHFRKQQCNQVTGYNVASNGGVWGPYYQGIGYCNKFIDDITTYQVKNLTNSDKVNYIAEAKFLKAYYHYKLMSACGPIPIIDSQLPMSLPKDQIPGRSHFDACVDYVVNLCDEVYPDLEKNFDNNSRYYGRATKMAAKMLKAKVLVLAASPLWNGSFPDKSWKNDKYQTPGYGYELVSKEYDPQKWERAEKACLEAIEEAHENGHKLFDLEDSEALRLSGGIALPKVPVSDEAARQEIAKRPMLMRYVTVARPNQGNKEIMWGCLWLNNEICSWASYPHYVLIRENGQPAGGWGMISPTLQTVESFFTKNGKRPADDPAFPSEGDWLRRAGFEGVQENVINLCANREPRFYAAVSFDGDEYSPVIANGSPLYINAMDPDQNGYNTDKYGVNNNSRTGFWNKKLVHPNTRYDTWGNDNTGTVIDHPWAIFRLADLYLIYAEACAHTGHFSEGLVYLNMIRKRAGVPEYTLAEVSDSEKFLKAVLEERFSELYLEGMRLEDIRRYVNGPKYMSHDCYQGLNVLEKNLTFETFNVRKTVEQQYVWHDRMYLQPVPDNEVYANPQMVQAPLY